MGSTPTHRRRRAVRVFATLNTVGALIVFGMLLDVLPLLVGAVLGGLLVHTMHGGLDSDTRPEHWPSRSDSS